MQFVYCLLSIALTALCWGVYGPVLHWGQEAMQHGRLRPLICVGIAYFLIGVLLPVMLISTGMEKDKSWSSTGTFWSLAAGAAGAVGALGIIMALSNGGHPSWVMPLVFGGAPVVNTILTISVAKQWNQLHPAYIAGLLLVGVGAVTVLIFKPAPAKAAAKAPVAAAQEAAAESKPAAEAATAAGKH